MDLLDRSAATAVDAVLRDCIEACGDCLRVLRSYARNGARAGPGSRRERAMWRLMLDCAEVCEATANLLRADLACPPQRIEACRKLCAECAAACDATAPSGPIGACAAACRRCAQACMAVSARSAARATPRGLHFA